MLIDLIFLGSHCTYSKSTSGTHFSLYCHVGTVNLNKPVNKDWSWESGSFAMSVYLWEYQEDSIKMKEQITFAQFLNKYLIYYYLHSSSFPFLVLVSFLSGRYLNSSSFFLHYLHTESLKGKERLFLPSFTALLTICKKYAIIYSAAKKKYLELFKVKSSNYPCTYCRTLRHSDLSMGLKSVLERPPLKGEIEVQPFWLFLLSPTARTANECQMWCCGISLPGSSWRLPICLT